jgi:hypothetical protein
MFTRTYDVLSWHVHTYYDVLSWHVHTYVWRIVMTCSHVRMTYCLDMFTRKYDVLSDMFTRTYDVLSWHVHTYVWRIVLTCSHVRMTYCLDMFTRTYDVLSWHFKFCCNVRFHRKSNQETWDIKDLSHSICDAVIEWVDSDVSKEPMRNWDCAFNDMKTK